MDSTIEAIIQLIPITAIGIFYALVVYIAARKRGTNPWGWTIGALVPVLGVFVSGIFLLLTFLSMLDRLNVLERKVTELVML